eukprot:GHVN01059946.1.p1 GENE.GHVN01059946.1~~GHVN01059946.1.p1  ORF type:complete len:3658 (-),score=726.11 GHVN01059946.1:112-11085(-)
MAELSEGIKRLANTVKAAQGESQANSRVRAARIADALSVLPVVLSHVRSASDVRPHREGLEACLLSILTLPLTGSTALLPRLLSDVYVALYTYGERLHLFSTVSSIQTLVGGDLLLPSTTNPSSQSLSSSSATSSAHRSVGVAFRVSLRSFTSTDGGKQVPLFTRAAALSVISDLSLHFGSQLAHTMPDLIHAVSKVVTKAATDARIRESTLRSLHCLITSLGVNGMGLANDVWRLVRPLLTEKSTAIRQVAFQCLSALALKYPLSAAAHFTPMTAACLRCCCENDYSARFAVASALSAVLFAAATLPKTVTGATDGNKDISASAGASWLQTLAGRSMASGSDEKTRIKCEVTDPLTALRWVATQFVSPPTNHGAAWDSKQQQGLICASLAPSPPSASASTSAGGFFSSSHSWTGMMGTASGTQPIGSLPQSGRPPSSLTNNPGWNNFVIVAVNEPSEFPSGRSAANCREVLSTTYLLLCSLLSSQVTLSQTVLIWLSTVNKVEAAIKEAGGGQSPSATTHPGLSLTRLSGGGASTGTGDRTHAQPSAERKSGSWKGSGTRHEANGSEQTSLTEEAAAHTGMIGFGIEAYRGCYPSPERMHVKSCVSFVCRRLIELQSMGPTCHLSLCVDVLLPVLETHLGITSPHSNQSTSSASGANPPSCSPTRASSFSVSSDTASGNPVGGLATNGTSSSSLSVRQSLAQWGDGNRGERSHTGTHSASGTIRGRSVTSTSYSPLISEASQMGTEGSALMVLVVLEVICAAAWSVSFPFSVSSSPHLSSAPPPSSSSVEINSWCDGDGDDGERGEGRGQTGQRVTSQVVGRRVMNCILLCLQAKAAEIPHAGTLPPGAGSDTGQDPSSNSSAPFEAMIHFTVSLLLRRIGSFESPHSPCGGSPSTLFELLSTELNHVTIANAELMFPHETFAAQQDNLRRLLGHCVALSNCVCLLDVSRLGAPHDVVNAVVGTAKVLCTTQVMNTASVVSVSRRIGCFLLLTGLASCGNEWNGSRITAALELWKGALGKRPIDGIRILYQLESGFSSPTTPSTDSSSSRKPTGSHTGSGESTSTSSPSPDANLTDELLVVLCALRSLCRFLQSSTGSITAPSVFKMVVVFLANIVQLVAFLPHPLAVLASPPARPFSPQRSPSFSPPSSLSPERHSPPPLASTGDVVDIMNAPAPTPVPSSTSTASAEARPAPLTSSTSSTPRVTCNFLGDTVAAGSGITRASVLVSIRACLYEGLLCVPVSALSGRLLLQLLNFVADDVTRPAASLAGPVAGLLEEMGELEIDQVESLHPGGSCCPSFVTPSDGISSTMVTPTTTTTSTASGSGNPASKLNEWCWGGVTVDGPRCVSLSVGCLLPDCRSSGISQCGHPTLSSLLSSSLDIGGGPRCIHPDPLWDSRPDSRTGMWGGCDVRRVGLDSGTYSSSPSPVIGMCTYQPFASPIVAVAQAPHISACAANSLTPPSWASVLSQLGPTTLPYIADPCPSERCVWACGDNCGRRAPHSDGRNVCPGVSAWFNASQPRMTSSAEVAWRHNAISLIARLLSNPSVKTVTRLVVLQHLQRSITTPTHGLYDCFHTPQSTSVTSRNSNTPQSAAKRTLGSGLTGVFGGSSVTPRLESGSSETASSTSPPSASGSVTVPPLISTSSESVPLPPCQTCWMSTDFVPACSKLYDSHLTIPVSVLLTLVAHVSNLLSLTSNTEGADDSTSLISAFSKHSSAHQRPGTTGSRSVQPHSLPSLTSAGGERTTEPEVSLIFSIAFAAMTDSRSPTLVMGLGAELAARVAALEAICPIGEGERTDPSGPTDMDASTETDSSLLVDVAAACAEPTSTGTGTGKVMGVLQQIITDAIHGAQQTGREFAPYTLLLCASLNRVWATYMRPTPRPDHSASLQPTQLLPSPHPPISLTPPHMSLTIAAVGSLLEMGDESPSTTSHSTSPSARYWALKCHNVILGASRTSVTLTHLKRGLKLLKRQLVGDCHNSSMLTQGISELLATLTSILRNTANKEIEALKHLGGKAPAHMHPTHTQKHHLDLESDGRRRLGGDDPGHLSNDERGGSSPRPFARERPMESPVGDHHEAVGEIVSCVWRSVTLWRMISSLSVRCEMMVVTDPQLYVTMMTSAFNLIEVVKLLASSPDASLIGGVEVMRLVTSLTYLPQWGVSLILRHLGCGAHWQVRWVSARLMTALLAGGLVEFDLGSGRKLHSVVAHLYDNERSSLPSEAQLGLLVCIARRYGAQNFTFYLDQAKQAVSHTSTDVTSLIEGPSSQSKTASASRDRDGAGGGVGAEEGGGGGLNDVDDDGDVEEKDEVSKRASKQHSSSTFASSKPKPTKQKRREPTNLTSVRSATPHQESLTSSISQPTTGGTSATSPHSLTEDGNEFSQYLEYGSDSDFVLRCCLMSEKGDGDNPLPVPPFPFDCTVPVRVRAAMVHSEQSSWASTSEVVRPISFETYRVRADLVRLLGLLLDAEACPIPQISPPNADSPPAEAVKYGPHHLIPHIESLIAVVGSAVRLGLEASSTNSLGDSLTTATPACRGWCGVGFEEVGLLLLDRVIEVFKDTPDPNAVMNEDDEDENHSETEKGSDEGGHTHGRGRGRPPLLLQYEAPILSALRPVLSTYGVRTTPNDIRCPDPSPQPTSHQRTQSSSGSRHEGGSQSAGGEGDGVLAQLMPPSVVLAVEVARKLIVGRLCSKGPRVASFLVSGLEHFSPSDAYPPPPSPLSASRSHSTGDEMGEVRANGAGGEVIEIVQPAFSSHITFIGAYNERETTLLYLSRVNNIAKLMSSPRDCIELVDAYLETMSNHIWLVLRDCIFFMSEVPDVSAFRPYAFMPIDYPLIEAQLRASLPNLLTGMASLLCLRRWCVTPHLLPLLDKSDLQSGIDLVSARQRRGATWSPHSLNSTQSLEKSLTSDKVIPFGATTAIRHLKSLSVLSAFLCSRINRVSPPTTAVGITIPLPSGIVREVMVYLEVISQVLVYPCVVQVGGEQQDLNGPQKHDSNSGQLASTLSDTSNTSPLSTGVNTIVLTLAEFDGAVAGSTIDTVVSCVLNRNDLLLRLGIFTSLTQLSTHLTRTLFTTDKGSDASFHRFNSSDSSHQPRTSIRPMDSLSRMSFTLAAIGLAEVRSYLSSHRSQIGVQQRKSAVAGMGTGFPSGGVHLHPLGTSSPSRFLPVETTDGSVSEWVSAVFHLIELWVSIENTNPQYETGSEGVKISDTRQGLRFPFTHLLLTHNFPMSFVSLPASTLWASLPPTSIKCYLRLALIAVDAWKRMAQTLVDRSLSDTGDTILHSPHSHPSPSSAVVLGCRVGRSLCFTTFTHLQRLASLVTSLTESLSGSKQEDASLTPCLRQTQAEVEGIIQSVVNQLTCITDTCISLIASSVDEPSETTEGGNGPQFSESNKGRHMTVEVGKLWRDVGLVLNNVERVSRCDAFFSTRTKSGGRPLLFTLSETVAKTVKSLCLTATKTHGSPWSHSLLTCLAPRVASLLTPFVRLDRVLSKSKMAADTLKLEMKNRSAVWIRCWSALWANGFEIVQDFTKIRRSLNSAHKLDHLWALSLGMWIRCLTTEIKAFQLCVSDLESHEAVFRTAYLSVHINKLQGLGDSTQSKNGEATSTSLICPAGMGGYWKLAATFFYQLAQTDPRAFKSVFMNVNAEDRLLMEALLKFGVA